MRYELQKRAGKLGKETLENFVGSEQYKTAATFSEGDNKAAKAFRKRLGEMLRYSYNKAKDQALAEFIADPVYGEVIMNVQTKLVDKQRAVLEELK